MSEENNPIDDDELEPCLENCELRWSKVDYFDLCEHPETSKAEFFNTASLKYLTVYGAATIIEVDVVGSSKRVKCIKVLHHDDVSDDEECEGIVIPFSCVDKITPLAADGGDVVVFTPDFGDTEVN